MDKIVVDSSVVIKWFVVEPLSAEARRVLDGYQTGAFAFHVFERNLGSQLDSPYNHS